MATNPHTVQFIVAAATAVGFTNPTAAYADAVPNTIGSEQDIILLTVDYQSHLSSLLRGRLSDLARVIASNAQFQHWKMVAGHVTATTNQSQRYTIILVAHGRASLFELSPAPPIIVHTDSSRSGIATTTANANATDLDDVPAKITTANIDIAAATVDAYIKANADDILIHGSDESVADIEADFSEAAAGAVDGLYVYTNYQEHSFRGQYYASLSADLRRVTGFIAYGDNDVCHYCEKERLDDYREASRAAGYL